jgi:hypothetical protein
MTSRAGLVLVFAGTFSFVAAQGADFRATSGKLVITADDRQETFSLSAGLPDALLQNGKLWTDTDGQLRPVTGWTVQAEANSLVIRTKDPVMEWRVSAAGEAVSIAATDYHAVVTGDSPAGDGRIVARLLDPEGAPVVWSGTGEVHENYGGSYTRSPSFLPRKNPDVLYVRLGALEGSGFHSVFDRDTDTAIDFGENAALARNDADHGVMKVTMPVPGHARIRLERDYYTRVLGVPSYSKYDDRRFPTAPIVWSSWTSYYEAVREQDITANADWLAAHLKPYGADYVELDDGYDRGPQGEHYWVENWDRQKFPHGAAWLTQHIHDQGLKAGIWMVPNGYAGAVKDHPERYVYDKQGKVLLDYHTPVLDQTNPATFDFLKHEFTVLDDWGFDYYKFDGEHAFPKYAPPTDLSRLHDPHTDLVQNFRDRVKLIRETIGPDRFIESCPAGTPLDSIGFADSYFNGDDLYNNWQGSYPLFSSISSNLFLNHLLVYVMPGEGIELGEPMSVEEAKTKRPPVVIEEEKNREDPMTGFGVTDAEARTLVSYVAMTGVVYPLASVMSELPASRVALLKATMPTLPVMPVDLFSRGNDNHWGTFRKQRVDYYIHNYPEILDLKVNAIAGRYDLIGVTNWRNAPAVRTVDVADKLALDAKQQYVAFDFWSQSLAGVFRGTLRLDVGPHDTRVIAIHAVTGAPQLVGNSRHISGAFSVLENQWDAPTMTLRGKAQTVGAEEYTAWIYRPAGFSLQGVEGATGDGKPVEVSKTEKGDLIGISFRGAGGAVRWSVRFTSGNN